MVAALCFAPLERFVKALWGNGAKRSDHVGVRGCEAEVLTTMQDLRPGELFVILAAANDQEHSSCEQQYGKPDE